MIPSFSYIRARSLDEAIHYLSLDGARAYAGGTDLLGCLRDRVFDVATVISIAGLKELRGIGATPAGGLRIGSLTTIAEVARNPVIRSKYRALSMAASEVASPQLRHQGTIGGNLCQKPRCWYYRGEFHCLRKGGDHCYAVEGENPYHCILGGENCFIVHPSDTAPALVALRASVTIAGPNGQRTVAVENFHMPPSGDCNGNRFATACRGPAKFLPQGSGTSCLGLRSGRRGLGDRFQRGSGGRFSGGVQRRSACALAF
jgi:xanthine dehydrogenase YagS FAD-binding subunit